MPGPLDAPGLLDQTSKPVQEGAPFGSPQYPHSRSCFCDALPKYFPPAWHLPGEKSLKVPPAYPLLPTLPPPYYPELPVQPWIHWHQAAQHQYPQDLPYLQGHSKQPPQQTEVRYDAVAWVQERWQAPLPAVYAWGKPVPQPQPVQVGQPWVGVDRHHPPSHEHHP